MPAIRLAAARVALGRRDARRSFRAPGSAKSKGSSIMTPVVSSLNDCPSSPPFVRGGKRTALAGAWSIFVWETKSFFLKPASYALLLAAALTASWSFSWLVTLLSRGPTVGLRPTDDPISQFLGPHVFLIGGCTLLVPLLTINAIADERRRATWEQLLTAPVSPLAVVLGKFAAAWCVFATCLVPWLYYIVVLGTWNGRFTTVWGG